MGHGAHGTGGGGSPPHHVTVRREEGYSRRHYNQQHLNLLYTYLLLQTEESRYEPRHITPKLN